MGRYVGTTALPGGGRPGRVLSIRLSVDLPPALEAQLAAVAARLNVRAEDLAAAALRDLLAQREADFQSAAAHVPAKNTEL